MSVRRCWSLGYWTGYNSLESSQKLVHIFVLTGASRLLVLAKAMMKTYMGREVKQVNALSNNIGLVAYSLIGFQQGKSTISWSMGAAII